MSTSYVKRWFHHSSDEFITSATLSNSYPGLLSVVCPGDLFPGTKSFPEYSTWYTSPPKFPMMLCDQSVLSNFPPVDTARVDCIGRLFPVSRRLSIRRQIMISVALWPMGSTSVMCRKKERRPWVYSALIVAFTAFKSGYTMSERQNLYVSFQMKAYGGRLGYTNSFRTYPFLIEKLLTE